jgi:hypothetical protein
MSVLEAGMLQNLSLIGPVYTPSDARAPLGIRQSSRMVGFLVAICLILSPIWTQVSERKPHSDEVHTFNQGLD